MYFLLFLCTLNIIQDIHHLLLYICEFVSVPDILEVSELSMT